MLYEGAIKNCNIGLDAIEKQDYVKANEVIIKAQEIVLELIATLDMNYGVSKEMKTSYTYIYELLVEANMKKDCELLREGKEHLKGFKEVWRKIMNIK